jgi:hypothetical protein
MIALLFGTGFGQYPLPAGRPNPGNGNDHLARQGMKRAMEV